MGTLPPVERWVVTTRVESPCVRNCCLDDDDVCLGCLRTLGEITAWSGASDADRTAILVAAAERADARRRTR